MRHILPPLPHVSGIDVLDIVLVAIIIYQFLMLIRGITIGATQARLEAELRKQLRLASNRDV